MISNSDMGFGVKGLILSGEKVLLLRKHNGQCDLPGGRLEEGENDEDCLQREIQEETGLCKVQISDQFTLWTLINRLGVVIRGATYLCRSWEGSIQLSPEHESFTWVSLEHLDSLDIYRKYGLHELNIGSLTIPIIRNRSGRVSGMHRNHCPEPVGIGRFSEKRPRRGNIYAF